MAYVSYKQLSKVENSRNKVHAPTQGTISIFKDAEGKKYLQIDTVGSKSRANPEKISQSVQFDEETIRFLLDLLKEQ